MKMKKTEQKKSKRIFSSLNRQKQSKHNSRYLVTWYQSHTKIFCTGTGYRCSLIADSIFSLPLTGCRHSRYHNLLPELAEHFLERRLVLLQSSSGATLRWRKMHSHPERTDYSMFVTKQRWRKLETACSSKFLVLDRQGQGPLS